MKKPLEKATFRKRLPKVFLCHSHADSVAIHALYSRLKKDGLEVWLDKETLSPGQDWEYEIRMGILKSDVVIACLSEQFNKQAGYRHEELKIALEKANLLPDDEVFIIPVRLEECEMPESLRRLQRVDLFEGGGYRRLRRALRRHAGLVWNSR
jgi:TIR domain